MQTYNDDIEKLLRIDLDNFSGTLTMYLHDAYKVKLIPFSKDNKAMITLITGLDTFVDLLTADLFEPIETHQVYCVMQVTEKFTTAIRERKLQKSLK